MNAVVLAAEEAAPANPYSSLIFLVLMGAVFYFLIIRPQRKRSKAQAELTANLAVGHQVRTIGGIHGTVLSMDEDSVLLQVEDGKIRVARRAIGSRVGADEV